MRSMSLSKRLAMAGGVPQTHGNQTIDLSQLGASKNFQTIDPTVGPNTDHLNNTAMIAHQFNTLMVQNELAAQGKRDRKNQVAVGQ